MNKAMMGRGVALLVFLAGAACASADDRSITGVGNNQTNPTWGMAGVSLIRMGPCAYMDEMNIPSGQHRPNPRAISNAISAQSGNTRSFRGLSDMVWQWGQFIDHDFSLSVEATPLVPLNIAVPLGDPHFDPMGTGTQIIPLNRSKFDPLTGTHPGNPRQQMNELTAYLDGSMVYGSDVARAEWLRSGSGGRLKVTGHATGDMMPFNDGTMPNAGGTGTNLFVAGDIRANEQVALAAMHTLWVREHNRRADAIAAANPTWNDEQVYQFARKIVGAQVQAITYNEWLPALIGQRGMNALGSYAGYDDQVNAGVANEFSTAAFRMGHTLLSSQILRLDENGQSIAQGPLSLRDAFFRPDRLTNEGGIDPILRGLASQRAQELDHMVIDDVRNFLFGPPGAGGFDLVSLNIQRGRDHGLPDINTVRVAYGLEAYDSFADLTSNAALQASFVGVYGDVTDVDPWIAMISEDHVPGASIGPTLMAILVDQFARLRDGDRYFYLDDPELLANPALLAEIDQMRLSDIITLNTGIINIPGNVFVIPAPGVVAVVMCAGLLAVTRRRT